MTEDQSTGASPLDTPQAHAPRAPRYFSVLRMAESDFMAYGSIEMIFACLVAFWLALQALQTISD